MERKMIFLILIALFAPSVFAVGGGGGSSSLTTSQLDIEVSYDCSTSVMIIKVTANGIGIDGITVKVLESATGKVVTTGITDFNGFFKPKISENNNYLLLANKSNYQNGDQSIEVNCGAVIQPPIKEVPKEPEFYCTEELTIKDRVKCVMNLPDEKVQAVRYVPEECNIKEEGKKANCIALYRTLQSCRGEDLESDVDRVKCIKPKINISENILDDVRHCQSLPLGNFRRTCFSNLKENAFTLVKFRIYNLIYKAEELQKLGADENTVVDFVTYVENAKIRFNNAEMIKDKIEIVKEVKREWKKFKDKAKTQIGEAQ